MNDRSDLLCPGDERPSLPPSRSLASLGMNDRQSSMNSISLKVVMMAVMAGTAEVYPCHEA